MKRLSYILAALLLTATSAFAAADRDVLITPEGVVYAVASTVIEDGSWGAASVIELTVQDGDMKSSVIIPDSTTPGTHESPVLAYDASTRTLFVVWLHMRNLMQSELLVAAYANGAWREATGIDHQPYTFRTNLRMMITRSIAQLQADGSYKDVPALLLHLLWWEITGAGEEARYAVLSVENGEISGSEIVSLAKYYPAGSAAPVDANFNRELLKSPSFLQSSAANSIEILAGDLKTNAFYRVGLRPSIDTRIRIPVGRNPVARINAPPSFSAPWTGQIDVISSPHHQALAFASAAGSSVSYITHTPNGWGSVKSIGTNAKLSVTHAMKALARSLEEQ